MIVFTIFRLNLNQIACDYVDDFNIKIGIGLGLGGFRMEVVGGVEWEGGVERDKK